jgi:hypothetical protein
VRSTSATDGRKRLREYVDTVCTSAFDMPAASKTDRKISTNLPLDIGLWLHVLLASNLPELPKTKSGIQKDKEGSCSLKAGHRHGFEPEMSPHAILTIIFLAQTHPGHERIEYIYTH